MKYFLIVTVLALIGCLVAGAKKTGSKAPIERRKLLEKSQCIGNVCIIARGKSGKMLVFLRGNGTDANAFAINFDFIEELDENNETIKGKSKHSFKNFAKTEFEFSDLENTTVKGASAYKFDFMATLEGPEANMTVEVYIIKEEKKVTLCDKNVYDVKRSSIKFNIKIEGWKFCGIGDDCGKGKGSSKNVTGKYIDFGIKLQGRMVGKKPKKQDRKDKGGDTVRKDYKFDDELSFVMPTTLEIDGSCSKMPEGFPVMRDDGVLTTFRFPVFNQMVVYDPFMTGDGEENGAQSATNLSFVLIALLAAFTQLL